METAIVVPLDSDSGHAFHVGQDPVGAEWGTLDPMNCVSQRMLTFSRRPLLDALPTDPIDGEISCGSETFGLISRRIAYRSE